MRPYHPVHPDRRSGRVVLYIMVHPADPCDAQKWAQNEMTFIAAIGFADGRFANI